jgi:hypothetical protein
MSNLTDCRGMEQLYRERAKADPQHSNQWLGQAERWKELAHNESAWRFQRRDTKQMHASRMAMGPDLLQSGGRWKRMG